MAMPFSPWAPDRFFGTGAIPKAENVIAKATGYWGMPGPAPSGDRKTYEGVAKDATLISYKATNATGGIPSNWVIDGIAEIQSQANSAGLPAVINLRTLATAESVTEPGSRHGML